MIIWGAFMKYLQSHSWQARERIRRSVLQLRCMGSPTVCGSKQTYVRRLLRQVQ